MNRFCDLLRIAVRNAFKPEQKPFPGRIIVFDFEVNDGADPGESVGKDPEQSAIALSVPEISANTS